MNNLRKLKLIRKNAMKLTDYTDRTQYIRKEIEKLGFTFDSYFEYLDDFYSILVKATPKQRTAIFRVGRAALKKNSCVDVMCLFRWYHLSRKTYKPYTESYEKNVKNSPYGSSVFGDLRLLPFIKRYDKSEVLEFLYKNIGFIYDEERDVYKFNCAVTDIKNIVEIRGVSRELQELMEKEIDD